METNEIKMHISLITLHLSGKNGIEGYNTSKYTKSTCIEVDLKKKKKKKKKKKIFLFYFFFFF